MSRQRTLRHGRLSVVLRLGAIPLQLLVMILLARILGEERLGVYFLILSTGTVVARLGCLGLNQSVIRLVAVAQSHSAAEVRDLVFRMSGVVALSAILVSMVFVTYAGGVIGGRVFASSEYVMLVPLTAVWLAALTMQSFWSGVMEAIQKVHWATFLMPGGTLRQMILLAIILATTVSAIELDVATVLSAMVVAGFVAICSAAYIFVKTRGLWNLENSMQSADIFRSGIPLMVTAVAIGISREIDIWILGAFEGDASVGRYRATARFAEVALMIEGMLMVVLRPYLAELMIARDTERIRRIAGVYVVFGLCVLVPLLAIFSLWGEELVLAVLGPGYIEGVWPMVVRTLGLIVMFMFGPVVAILQVSERSGDLVRAMLVGIPVQVALTFLGVLALGAVGAALGWVSGLIVIRAVMAWRCWTKLDVRTGIRVSAESLRDSRRIVRDLLR